MGLLAKSDGEVLAGLCQNWSVFVRLSKDLNALKTSSLHAHSQLFRFANESYRNYLRGCEHFGLTPAARSRIHVPQATSKVNDKKRFFAAGG